MALRLNIFLRTVALLGVLVIISTIVIVSFVISLNRQYWDERARQEVSFITDQTDRLVLWDDRVALQDLLESLVASIQQIDYAFVERNGIPFAHTFKAGVPVDLLESSSSTGEVFRLEFRDMKGSVFYDYSLKDEFSGTTVHLGVSRYKVDRETGGVANIVLLAGLSLFLLSLLPGWAVSDAITREVNQMNEELKKVNRELERRVEERTSELSGANEALKAEMAERKKLEKQRDDFLSMIRHDMRTPLSVIYGYAELIGKHCEGKDDGELTKMLMSIMSSSQKLSRMVDDMSEMSKLESGSLVLQCEPIDLYGVAMEEYLDFSARASDKGITLKTDIPEDLPRISADEHYVKRAAANLLSNAFEYTPGGSTVTISGGVTGEGGKTGVFFSVTDTGPGIPEEERERIFEKYYRGGGQKSGGRGLGLAIVKAVMKAHNGRVELASEPGKGSTFMLVFPAV